MLKNRPAVMTAFDNIHFVVFKMGVLRMRDGIFFNQIISKISDT